MGSNKKSFSSLSINPVATYGLLGHTPPIGGSCARGAVSFGRRCTRGTFPLELFQAVGRKMELYGAVPFAILPGMALKGRPLASLLPKLTASPPLAIPLPPIFVAYIPGGKRSEGRVTLIYQHLLAFVLCVLLQLSVVTL